MGRMLGKRILNMAKQDEIAGVQSKSGRKVNAREDQEQSMCLGLDGHGRTAAWVLSVGMQARQQKCLPENGELTFVSM